MMVLADSKNVIKIFLFVFVVSSHSIILLFLLLYSPKSVENKRKKGKNRFSCIYLRVLLRRRRKGGEKKTKEQKIRKSIVYRWWTRSSSRCSNVKTPYPWRKKRKGKNRRTTYTSMTITKKWQDKTLAMKREEKRLET